MPLMPIPPIPTKWTRRFGPFTAVTPCSALSGHPVHPTCPATMGSTYRSVWPSSSRPALERVDTDARDVRGGVRPAERAGAVGHLDARLGVREQRRERICQPPPVQVAVEDHPRPSGSRDDLRVPPLVVVGG